MKHEWLFKTINEKNINDINKIYYNVIKNYNDLNKVFKFQDPIEIYTMFNYCLLNGYLSKDKNFEFGIRNLKDITNIYGSNILNGTGVCRHIAVMFKDILNDNNITNEVLPVYLGNGALTNKLQGLIKDLEQQYNNINIKNPGYNKEREKILSKLKEIKILLFNAQVIDNNILEEGRRPNHLINFAVKDNTSYFLDSTNCRIYRLKNNNLVLWDEFDNFIRIYFKDIKTFSKKCDLTEIKRQIILPSKDVDSSEKIYKQTLLHCKNNLDVFEKFYNENKDAYDEVSKKLTKIKTHII